MSDHKQNNLIISNSIDVQNEGEKQHEEPKEAPTY